MAQAFSRGATHRLDPRKRRSPDRWKIFGSCPDASLQFEWLDEQRIAIDCSKQIFVIDGASGKQLAQADTQE